MEHWFEQKERQRQESIKQTEITLAKEANDIIREANRISQEAKNKATLVKWIALGSIFFTLLNFLYSLYIHNSSAS